MDAIEFLTEQHREIVSLFDQFETALRARPKLRLWRKLARLISVHATVEDRIFFPVVKGAGFGEMLPKAFDAHLWVEHMLAGLLGAREVTDALVARAATLRKHIEQHMAAEEKELFRSMREMFPACQLDALGRHMASVADRLMDEAPPERLVPCIAQA
jgi:hemerythrin-like domain-containing protein